MMSKEHYQDPFLSVLQFKRVVDRGRNIGGPDPGFPGIPKLTLARALVREEYLELEHATENGDLVEVMDAVADLVYVTYGFAIACGVDIRPVFAEVHRTNMAKVGGSDNSLGKIGKPVGWTPPDVAGTIKPLPTED